MKEIWIPVALALSLALGACGHHDYGGDAFVGQWKKVGGTGLGVTVSRNGDRFLIDNEIPDFNKGGIAIQKFDAVMKDGTLQILFPIGAEVWTIEQKTGHLIRPGEELAKVTK